jgi:hypothetical protein
MEYVDFCSVLSRCTHVVFQRSKCFDGEKVVKWGKHEGKLSYCVLNFDTLPKVNPTKSIFLLFLQMILGNISCTRGV